MKRLLFICFFAINASLLAMQTLSVQQVDICLLTWGRSGTEWVTYMFQNITNRPSMGYRGLEIIQAKTPIDYKKGIVLRTHTPQAAAIFNNGCKLLILVRNYKEIFARRVPEQNLISFMKNKPRHFKDYFDILNVYELWPEDKRLIIYYEDLIKSPKTEIPKIIGFLEQPMSNQVKKNLSLFLQQLERHQRISIDNYTKRHSVHGDGSVTKGEDLFFHSKKISHKTIEHLQQVVKTMYPYLWEKYLTRYDD